MASRRPRRSRIYDSNFNMGESYYKSAIDRLDEKYSSGSRASSLLKQAEGDVTARPKYESNFDFQADGADEDLAFARSRASKVIHEDNILDTRSGHKAAVLENEFDDQIKHSLNRIQASKKLISSIEQNGSLEQSTGVVQRRAIKVVSNVQSINNVNESSKNELTKWSKLNDYNDSESFAALRAQRSKQRIQEIDSDIVERNARSQQREVRAANLKRLIADNSDFSSNVDAGLAKLTITKTTAKRVVSY